MTLQQLLAKCCNSISHLKIVAVETSWKVFPHVRDHNTPLKIEIDSKKVHCVHIWAQSDCHCVSRCAISFYCQYSWANFCYHCEYHIGYHNVVLSQIGAHCGYHTAAVEVGFRECIPMNFWWE